MSRIRCIMSQPFKGPDWSKRRTSNSSVPCNNSVLFSFFIALLSPLDRARVYGIAYRLSIGAWESAPQRRLIEKLLNFLLMIVSLLGRKHTSIRRVKEILFGMKEKKLGKGEAKNRAEESRSGIPIANNDIEGATNDSSRLRLLP